MRDQISEYHNILKQMVDLQIEIIQAFEKIARVVSLPSDFPVKFRERLEKVVVPGYSISQVLSCWPNSVGIVPILVWVRPKRGVLRFEGQNWLFDLHGCTQVSFLSLPSSLDLKEIESLEMGQVDILVGLPVSEPSVHIEIEYLQGGRSDGISAWSALTFARSTHSKVRHLSLLDHKSLLEKLAEKGLLIRWHSLSIEQGQHFILASEERRTDLAR